MFRTHIHVLLHLADILSAIADIDYLFRHFSKADLVFVSIFRNSPSVLFKSNQEYNEL